MDINKIKKVQGWLSNVLNNPNFFTYPLPPQDVINIKNELIRISHDIVTNYPVFSEELFLLKDSLFVGYGTVQPVAAGRVFEILLTLQQPKAAPENNVWSLMHPSITAVSRKLYEDGHFANAAGDAFIEINDRVKRLFQIVKPNEANIPDGQTAMNTVFSDNNPLVEFCDRSTDTGRNIQKGYMQMLAGAMSALRNPKAHSNITITAEDAMRRLVYASMLMYKIDEAVKYSKIQEQR